MFSPHEWQRRAVQEFHQLGGYFCAAPPGAGKTWVGAQVAREPLALLLVPAGVLDQTVAAYAAYGVPDVTARSYTYLSHHPTALEDMGPKVLILEEAHRLKNVTSAAWAKQVARYLAAHPEVRVLVLTGTPTHRDPHRDAGHLVRWALRGRHCPLPRGRGIELTAEEFWARLRGAPGVYLGEEGAGAWSGAVEITEHVLAPLAPEYERVLETWIAPDGWALGTPLELRELLSQLAVGGWYARNPRPTPEFLAARAAWARTVRYCVTYGLADTEARARLVRPKEYAEFRRVGDYDPDVTWEEITPLDVSPYLRPGTIVWAHHRALGERLAARLGATWYGDRDAGLGTSRDDVAVASIAACSEGTDGAQFHYTHNVVVEPPSDARVWQQLLSRTARQGNPRPLVTCDVMSYGDYAHQAFTKAVEQAAGLNGAQWLSTARKTTQWHKQETRN